MRCEIRPNPGALRGRDKADGRELLALFAGHVLPDRPAYSRGVRQYMAEHFQSKSGFKLVEGHYDGYCEDLHRSTFCLAPEGLLQADVLLARPLNL